MKTFIACAALLSCGAAAAAVTVDSGTISGLGARNIGSATMSGRIAALAAGEIISHIGARPETPLAELLLSRL